jgi:hypothetical protein
MLTGLAQCGTYLRLSLNCVEVRDSEIRIRGPKASLAMMAVPGSPPPTADMVPSLIREWRPVLDGTRRCR